VNESRESWRRDLFREIRRRVLSPEPGRDLRTFLTGVLTPIIEGTKATGCGVMVRFHESTRDLLLLVTSEGRVFQSYHPLAENPQRVPAGPTDGNTFSHPELAALARRAGLTPGRVLIIPVAMSGEATLELVDPDPDIVPNAMVLQVGLPEVAASFEMAYLHARLRRERLEARLLQTVGQELGRALDMPSLLNSILDLLRQVVPYDAAAIFVLASDALDVAHQAVRGYDEASEDRLRLKVGEGIVGSAVKEGRAQIVPDVRDDPRYVDARDRSRSEMVAPLVSGGRVLGAFNLESDRINAYTAHDLELLNSFAGHAAVALERAQLLEEQKARARWEQEISIARRIQRFFLPRRTESLRARGAAGRTVASLEVSGDYYDFVEREDGSMITAVADVSGKGIPAALIMSSLRSALRLEAPRIVDPAVWCRNLNELLLQSLRDTEFVTGVFGVVDRDHTRFRYCNAGHNPPLLLRASGSTEWLDVGGPILGAFPGLTYDETEVALEPGDLLVCYTDGVTEAFSPAEEEFEPWRLVDTVRRHRTRTPDEVCLAVIRAVRRFVRGPLPDDLTVTVVRGGRP